MQIAAVVQALARNGMCQNVVPCRYLEIISYGGKWLTVRTVDNESLRVVLANTIVMTFVGLAW